MLIIVCWGFVFFSSVHSPHRACGRESLGAAALHSITCFFTAEMFPSESTLLVRVLAELVAQMGP